MSVVTAPDRWSGHVTICCEREKNITIKYHFPHNYYYYNYRIFTTIRCT